MSTTGEAAPVSPELRLQTILGRYNAMRTEIQWRAVQRDALVIFAFTLVGVVLGSLDKIGLGVLLLPFPLVYLAAMWLQHDRRIGSLAQYLRNEIEPAMKMYDGLVGLEEYLDINERARSYARRFHFTAIMSRLLFPSLQGLALGTGAVLWWQHGPFSTPAAMLMVMAGLLILGSIMLTFSRVKHERVR